LRTFASPTEKCQSEVDVAGGLRSTLHLVGHSLREAGIEISVEIADGIPPITGKRGELNQVFLNLLKNAKEAFTEPGGHVYVTAVSDDSEIRVEIRDDGPGISEQDRVKLFEPFFTTKPAGEGSGLGLSISRRVVMEHGGTIDVNSSPGEGTRFEIRLPLSGTEECAEGEMNPKGPGGSS
jgi:signal transduction histidine kinase